MSPSKSTTLRLSTELRDEIARLAHARDSSMVDVVAVAISQLKQQEWWDRVRSALSDVDSDYHAHAQIFDRTAGDGIG